MQNGSSIIFGVIGILAIVGLVVALLFFGFTGPSGSSIDGQARQVIDQKRIVTERVQRYKDFKITPTRTSGGGLRLYLQYDYDLGNAGILIADENDIKSDSPIATKDSRIFWIGVDGYIHSYDTETHSESSAPLVPDSFAGDDVAAFDGFEWLVGYDEETGEFTFIHVVTGEETLPIPPESTGSTAVGAGPGVANNQGPTNTETTPANQEAPSNNQSINGGQTIPENTPGNIFYAQGSYVESTNAPPVAVGEVFSASLLSGEHCAAVALPLQVQTDPVLSLIIVPTRDIPRGTTVMVSGVPSGVDVHFGNGAQAAHYTGSGITLGITRYVGAFTGEADITVSMPSLEDPFSCKVHIVNE